MDKIRTLLSFLEKDPHDAFVLYSLGVEHMKQELPEKALKYFDRLLATNPEYVAQYYQHGKLLEQMGRFIEAAQAYNAGIEIAMKAGDAHTAGELKTALLILEDSLE